MGPLPVEGLALPAQTRFVAGLDVKRLQASPFYQRFAERGGPARLEALEELRQKTGLDPVRDVDQLVVAGGQGGDGGDEAIVLMLGSFDRDELASTIEQRPGGVTRQDHMGTAVYLFEGSRDGGAGMTRSHGPAALAFLGERSLVIGSRPTVEATIANRAEGTESVKSNVALMGLLESVRPGSTFWLVGDKSVLARLPTSLAAPGGLGGSGFELPALESLVVTGGLDPVLSIQVTAEAADEAAATKLADLVRGFTALLALQASQRPELRELASGISVTTEATRVHLSARVPHEVLESLVPNRPAAEDQPEDTVPKKPER